MNVLIVYAHPEPLSLTGSLKNFAVERLTQAGHQVQLILNLLNELKQAGDLTMVLVSHDADVIDHMCDRSVAMAHGRIIV